MLPAAARRLVRYWRTQPAARLGPGWQGRAIHSVGGAAPGRRVQSEEPDSTLVLGAKRRGLVWQRELGSEAAGGLEPGREQPV